MIELESNSNQDNSQKTKELEQEVSSLKLELEETRLLLNEEKDKKQFYELISEFTYGWEIWMDPDGQLRYSSPSCYDLTGFSANQLIKSESFIDILIYDLDKESFKEFISNALNQLVLNQSHEFRILTRHKQLRWCSMNIRGVYNKQGRYLGIRASIHDITHLKQALGQIRNLSTGKEIENRAKLRFRSELDFKKRELISFLLQLSQKNEYIAFTINQLKKIKGGNLNAVKKKVDELLDVLSNIPTSPVDWEMMSMQIENLHPGFLNRLMLKHPNLTAKEKKLCAFLRLDLSSKDISGLQNVQPKSVEIARVRLRKKLKINRNTRLGAYLNDI